MSSNTTHIDHSIIGGHDNVINHQERVRQELSPKEEKLLSELKSIQARLERTEPLIADSIEELRKAIEKKNTPKAAQIIGKLSTGVASSVIAKVASEGLLTYLGMK